MVVVDEKQLQVTQILEMPVLDCRGVRFEFEISRDSKEIESIYEYDDEVQYSLCGFSLYRGLSLKQVTMDIIANILSCQVIEAMNYLKV